MSRVRADRYTNREGTGAPTFSQGVNIVGMTSITGVGSTALLVNGDARVTGVLTVGQGSVTISGDSITGVTTAGITSAYVNSINDLNYPTAGPLSNRNLIINGAMQVAQRGTSETSVTTNGYYTVDRIKWVNSSLGTWTLEQSTDSPDGFSNSFKATCTTADVSPAAGDYAFVTYKIEAQNLQHLEYGSSSAKPLTLSFYVKSNKTGNASFNILQPDNSNEMYSAQYTINSADTWEKKTITIPADTSGVINNDNEAGLQLSWWLNSGSDYTSGSFGGWKTFENASRNPSNLGVGGAISDYFAITGVQLEVGERATPFEHLPFDVQLQRCLRYFQKSYRYGYLFGDNRMEGTAQFINSGSSNSYFTVNLISNMVDYPTVTTVRKNGGAEDQAQFGTSANYIGISVGSLSEHSFTITPDGGGITGVHYGFHYYADAEL